MTEPAADPGFFLAPQEYDPAIPVESLSEHPRNPNQGDIGAIHQSMTAHGYYGGILVQRSTGWVLRGNHTYRTAKALGAVTVPGFWIDVDDAEGERIMLDDNHAARLGLDDDALLLALLAEHAQSDRGLPATYTGDDLDDIAARLADPEPPDDFPEFGDDIPTDYQCPSCSYRWSGNPAPKNTEEAEAGG